MQISIAFRKKEMGSFFFHCMILIINFFQCKSIESVVLRNLDQFNASQGHIASNNDPIQDDICSFNKSCFDCINNDFCEWMNDSCKRVNILYQSYKRYQKCSNGDVNNILCGNFVYYPNIENPTYINYSVSPTINGKYYEKDLYCKVSLSNLNISNVKIEFLKNIDHNKLKLSLHIVYRSNLGFDQVIDLTNEKSKSLNFNQISGLNFYFLSKEQISDLPLIIKISPYENSSASNSYVWIIVISSLIPLLIGLLTLFCRICARSRMIIIANGPGPQAIQSNHIILELNNANDQNINNSKLFDEYYKEDLKTTLYKKGMNNYGEDCSVCIEPMIEDKSLVIRLPCNHFFHETCIKDWIKPNVNLAKCPYCNDNILEHLKRLKSENLIVNIKENA